MRHILLTAWFFLLLASFAQAQSSVIDSLQKMIARGKRDSTEASAYISLANEFSRSDMAAAKRCSFSAVLLSRQLNLPVRLSAAYSNLATLNAQTNQPDSARYYLDLLKDLANEYPINRIRSNYNLTAGIFYRKQGNYKASLPYMLEGLRLYILEGNKLGMAGQDLNIGNDYLDMSEYRNAMIYHLKALGLFEELGNKRGLSFCYSAIGGDFIKLDQFSKALPYIQKSLALKDELNDKKGKADSYISLGGIQEGLQHPENALASYMEALSINKELHLTIEEAKTDLKIARLYEKRNDANNAKAYFSGSKALFLQLGDTAYLAAVTAEIANRQNNLTRQEATEKTFISALSTSIRMGDKNSEINNYKYLSDFYAKNGQYDKALVYNEKYHNETDSLQNKELQLQVRTLEQQYNLEKKEKEISLLKKDRLLYQANLQKQEIFRYGALVFFLLLVAIGFLVMARYRVVHKARRLLEIEKIRNNIARNLHDDIGSTLSSINILSKVALQQADGNINVSRDLEKIKNRSFTIMESMSDIVWAINPDNDPLDKTLLKMREFAGTILEPAGIGFTFSEVGKLSDLKLGVEERKNFYLIFKEAINNTVKYSKATSIDVVLHKTAHQFLLKIADNGKGFDSRKQYSGNGLKNMQSRASEMNAVFEIDSAPGAGTRVCVALPIT